MECGDPVLCYNGDKKRIFRNWSMSSDIIRRHADQIFDCGKCLHCRKAKSQELAMRCVLHSSLYRENCFLTLTYDEKKEGYHNELQYKDIQLFKKSLRRQMDYHQNKKIQIFNVHEYGKNRKKHWHLVVFNYTPEDRALFTSKNGIPLYSSESLASLWGHGFITIGDVSEASALYQAQYTQKDFKNGNAGSKQRKAKSNHSAIGKEWFLQNYEQVLKLGYVPFNGQKRKVPRYFEKLAHKHWCSFNDQSQFRVTPDRKKVHTFLPQYEANEHISELFDLYTEKKQEKIKEKEEKWQETVQNYFKTGNDPGFMTVLHISEKEIKKNLKQEKF